MYNQHNGEKLSVLGGGESPLLDSTANPPKLNHKNFLNLIFFIINIVFTYGVGTASWFGNGTNGELSLKYQTIITPNSGAFSIWAVIFIFQSIFTVAQFLPRFRAKPMVQQGVGYWFMVTCITQVGWTFSFSFEAIPLSLVFMLLILASLYTLLYTQYYTESDGSLFEFWILRFPFAVHAGWITAASALNVNVVAVWKNESAAVQLAVGIVCLAVLHAVSVWVLFNIEKPNYTIACVLSWANGWIYAELQTPANLIQQTFSEDTIKGVAYAALAVCFIILAQLVVRVGIAGYMNYRAMRQQVVES
mmetsp:Transcript_2395/g.3161  ORF Transcript_2395/g.3161 Transcript_2395/m.3161 type:complete len:305 (-) Transcript_2395:83-997(-)|eukprot:CAMPEP_0172498426 /NCGR_PEP_ID=MMETSP1066-20121228/113426_1 /TAXON_ID=671091 /ORGANISM="Coscinodiscus wailesii, Strain CCMP2513" /LENGTH=304 /DNA_ID=CAMNT_0013271703 /DNA_START=106 /DNA_END=1020 /DNA_ORIENTATION=+